eukprot:6089306-Amphidinium_carterae.1
MGANTGDDVPTPGEADDSSKRPKTESTWEYNQRVSKEWNKEQEEMELEQVEKAKTDTATLPDKQEDRTTDPAAHSHRSVSLDILLPMLHKIIRHPSEEAPTFGDATFPTCATIGRQDAGWLSCRISIRNTDAEARTIPRSFWRVCRNKRDFCLQFSLEECQQD